MQSKVSAGASNAQHRRSSRSCSRSPDVALTLNALTVCVDDVLRQHEDASLAPMRSLKASCSSSSVIPTTRTIAEIQQPAALRPRVARNLPAADQPIEHRAGAAGKPLIPAKGSGHHSGSASARA